MTRRRFLATIPLLLLTACALREPPAQLLDLGPAPVPAAGAATGLPPLHLAGVQAPPWLDEARFYYRLLYDNPQQPRPYRASRWLMPPRLLFEQRLRARLAGAGLALVPDGETRTAGTTLRIELDDFTQNFSSPAGSSGRVLVHASLYTGRQLCGQMPFQAQAAAGSADAAGGARALADASDALISSLIRWMLTRPFNP